MKMTHEDFIRTQNLITSYVKDHNIMPRSEYPGMNLTRYCWDIFHGTLDRLQYKSVSDYLFLRSLYDYLKDDHIDTALRKILSV